MPDLGGGAGADGASAAGIKKLADEALKTLSPMFDEMYAATGRPSIPPERLLKATLLMALYTVRSERLLCEQLDYNLLFRGFLDMDMVEESVVPTVFTKNRERLRGPRSRASRRRAPTRRTRRMIRGIQR